MPSTWERSQKMVARRGLGLPAHGANHVIDPANRRRKNKASMRKFIDAARRERLAARRTLAALDAG